MNHKLKIVGVLILAGFRFAHLPAQSIQLLSSGTSTSIRGLSVVSDQVIWVSGSNGTVGRSTDGGSTFKWTIVKGFEKTDFRDIEAFDERSAVIMGISEPAYFLKTNDGAETWQLVYENNTKGMFADAMDFLNNTDGIAVGDPVNGKFFIARTFDGGNTWKNLEPQNSPIADSGEGCFASSGTNIRMLNKTAYIFVSGGLTSNLFIGNIKITLPVIQGKESTGANSVAVKNNKTFIVVGGDFSTKDSATKNCFYTTDGGKTWIPPSTPPHGYRSCVEWLEKRSWISCGLTGIDFSSDEGNNWTWISKEGFHVCRKAKKGTAVFFAGGGGRIAKLSTK